MKPESGNNMYKNIIFDFDGVLVDSNPIRINGFKELFKGFPKEQVEVLSAFAEVNGGLSRYEKIKYFFNSVRKETILWQEVERYAQKYSDIVKNDVIEAEEIEGAVDFLRLFAGRYTYSIVSGSEQEELRDICRQRGIYGFFKEILGSPSGKEKNLEDLIRRNNWEPGTCVFVGDSINDHKAAIAVGIPFIGRNSGMAEWRDYPGVPYFKGFGELSKYLKAS